MLTIYRRHRKSCLHRDTGRHYRRCRCPIWVDGMIGETEIRKSLRLANWEKAQTLVREWEAQGAPTGSQQGPVTLEEACEHFLNDCKARHLSPSTVKKYCATLGQLQCFADRKGVVLLRELDTALMRDFRSGWSEGPLSALKKIERLRAFFRYASENGWIDSNPAKPLKAPQVRQRPTMPFTREEMTQILAACDIYPDNFGRPDQLNAKRLRAFVLLLRYTGLRISDAATLACERLKGNRLFLYTAKTGVPVYCLLPDFAVEALQVPPISATYFFWTGQSAVETVSGNWRRSLSRLFELAGVSDGHPHRFRDTFAVELLCEGVPLEQVAALLGHTSIRVTERHYAPWVRSRQDQLEASMRRAWSRDPVAFSETKGTREVHGADESVN